MYLRKKFGRDGTLESACYFAIMKIFKRTLLILAILLMSMAANAQKSNYVSHTVSQGETLYAISKRYNTTVDAIIKFNPGCAEKLSIGQKLIIPRNTVNKAKSEKFSVYHCILSVAWQTQAEHHASSCLERRVHFGKWTAGVKTCHSSGSETSRE